jgi:hypothetical protein
MSNPEVVKWAMSKFPPGQLVRDADEPRVGHVIAIRRDNQCVTHVDIAYDLSHCETISIPVDRFFSAWDDADYCEVRVYKCFSTGVLADRRDQVTSADV